MYLKITECVCVVFKIKTPECDKIQSAFIYYLLCYMYALVAVYKRKILFST